MQSRLKKGDGITFSCGFSSIYKSGKYNQVCMQTNRRELDLLADIADQNIYWADIGPIKRVTRNGRNRTGLVRFQSQTDRRRPMDATKRIYMLRNCVRPFSLSIIYSFCSSIIHHAYLLTKFFLQTNHFRDGYRINYAFTSITKETAQLFLRNNRPNKRPVLGRRMCYRTPIWHQHLTNTIFFFSLLSSFLIPYIIFFYTTIYTI